jgi:glycosyltransferase involved in cell wall biosynthesis
MAPPFFSIIIPVYNGAATLAACLESVYASDFTDWELIVVDDGSTDQSADIARLYGALLLSNNGRWGPAAARNLGAGAARGRYLFFTDADCRLRRNTLSHAAAVLQSEPALDALFGSYDDQPAAPNFLSQYKNLFHHYIHQNSRPVATTFWTGCGAMSRATFLALGGFDAARYPRASIEDIELGYRLTQAGGLIRLAKNVQAQHLKQWTFTGLLLTDIRDRAIPWARLLRRLPHRPADLNLQTHHRLSVIALWGLLLSVASGRKKGPRLPRTLLLTGGLLWLNRDLYRFFYRRRGVWFTARAILWHWFYYGYGSLAAVHALLTSDRERRPHG